MTERTIGAVCLFLPSEARCPTKATLRAAGWLDPGYLPVYVQGLRGVAIRCRPAMRRTVPGCRPVAQKGMSARPEPTNGALGG